MMGITIDDRHAQNSKWKSTQSNFFCPLVDFSLHRLDDSINDAEVNFAPNFKAEKILLTDFTAVRPMLLGINVT